MLGEHLQEIRALRLRLEESIRTNDRLREQLEKKLAEVEKDSGRREIGFCPRFGVVFLLFVNRMDLSVCMLSSHKHLHSQRGAGPAGQ